MMHFIVSVFSFLVSFVSARENPVLVDPSAFDHDRLCSGATYEGQYWCSYVEKETECEEEKRSYNER